VAATVGGEVRFALNGPLGKRALRGADTGEAGPLPGAGADAPPNIYVLYEETIGTISPLVADELRAAEEEYPQEWIEAAFREAAAQNRRSWRYVSRILERWRDEGRHDAATGRDPRARRDFAGRYRSLIRR
jgi:DNA replication protein